MSEVGMPVSLPFPAFATRLIAEVDDVGTRSKSAKFALTPIWVAAADRTASSSGLPAIVAEDRVAVSPSLWSELSILRLIGATGPGCCGTPVTRERAY